MLYRSYDNFLEIVYYLYCNISLILKMYLNYFATLFSIYKIRWYLKSLEKEKCKDIMENN